MTKNWIGRRTCSFIHKTCVVLRGFTAGEAKRMADAALNVLGLSYGSGSDDDDDDEEEEEEQDAPAPAAPSAAAMAAAAAAATPGLPDIGDMLDDVPDWNEVGEEPEPSYDRPGTNYNAVPLPSSMSREAADHNRKSAPGAKPGKGRGRGTPNLSFPPSDLPAASQKPRAQQPMKRAAEGGGALLTPQLRRPNVATEDQSAIRTAKRPKGAH